MGKLLAFNQKGQAKTVYVTLICEECGLESSSLDLCGDELYCSDCKEASERRARLTQGWDAAEEE